MKTEVDDLDTYTILGCLETVSKDAARQIETELRNKIEVLETKLGQKIIGSYKCS